MIYCNFDLRHFEKFIINYGLFESKTNNGILTLTFVGLIAGDAVKMRATAIGSRIG